MDERKRKLEELRKKKKQLQDLVKGKESAPQTPPPDPAKESSSKRVDTSSSISESSTTSNPVSLSSSVRKRNSFLEDPAKNQKLFEIHLKKVNESLRTSNSETHFIQGIYPDVKSEETQYKLPEEFEEKQKEEELLKQQMEKNKKNTKFARRASTKVETKDPVKTLKSIQLMKNKMKVAMKKNVERNIFYSKNENQLKAYCDTDYNILNDALASNDIYDICNSYYNEEESDVNISKKTLVKHTCDLSDDQCYGRIVTAIDWCPNQSDLLLSAFSGTEDFNQQSGLIQLWALSNTKTPNYVINYQTEITSAIFCKDNPKLVIGGSVTGQIMFWDTSAGKPVPEQKSVLGIGNENNSHCYPIHCLAFGGKDNNLISISTDGVLCEWSLSNLSTPINRYVINPTDTYDQDKDSLNEIGPLSIGTNQSNSSIILGCDENDIYNIKLEERKYTVIDTYKGSKGPVFCVDIHPSHADWGNAFSDLFLSCGADWTTKLWTTSQSDEPLLTFNQSKDYVYSAKWHPTNPSIFATADGSGYIDLWDLNRDKEIPTYRYDLKVAINRLAWNSDGKKLAAGDINGRIAIFTSEKDVVNVKTDDIKKFEDTMTAVKERCKLEAEKKKKKEMK